MDVTLGDPDVFTEGTVEEVLEKARAAARAETEAALRAEREKRLEAERRAADAEARREAQRDRFRSIGTRGGYWIARIILVIVIVLLALMIYLTLPKPFPDLPGEWRRFLHLPCLFILGIFSIANLTFGTSFISHITELETRASRLIEQTLIRVVMP